ncbi:hypothetical protein BUALT_Bualt14G0065000 [Buddleja alternifolia]|uniref:Uncharacterized protein n=1 Tax=Buddleja alternifolia TaxID=168488 RepID=A0AAV6WM18_9LAMI|nr:hypothetical protein BUALT_Bualt14G0065000 [Buddleja alternifolia]
MLDANDEVASLSSNLEKIHQVLADADQKGVTDPKVKSWLEKLQDIAYEIDDAVDKWEVENIRQQYGESEDSSGSSEDPSMAEEESSSRGEDDIKIISIVGTGGMGKTTLAQLAFDEIKNQKVFKTMWICVSDPFDGIKVAQTILDQLHVSYSTSSQFQTLLDIIEESTLGKKFFLVLDDVWTEKDTMWKPLRKSLSSGVPGSRILVTTRKEEVAEVMGSTHIYPLEGISDIDCWLVLSQIAFKGRRESHCKMLEKTGQKIAEKCKGMPLAAKTIGGLLHSKTTLQQWENVLNSEVWELEEVKKDLFPLLTLSYNELEPAIKCRFSYCATFPKDTIIDVDDLIRTWMAQGFLSSSDTMELQGREYFEDLAMRSFFQDFELSDLPNSIESCKMHDIVHDFAQFLTKNECLIVGEAHGGQRVVAGHDARHLSLIQCQDKTNFSFFPQLRSFFCKDLEIPPYLFSHLKRVRLLSLGKLEELEASSEWRDLRQLQGILRIRIMGDMEEVEVKEAELKNKIFLQFLELDVERDELLEIMEDIHPPPHLEGLTFKGLRLPKWSTTLIQLRKLEFSGNNMYDFSWSLPPLRKLPFLEELVIDDVQTLDRELLGMI